MFGCLAFAHNPSRMKDKFWPRGVPCIFIGYSPSQKGYRMHNLLTGVSFVSRDVKFCEAISPYHLFHSTSVTNSESENTRNTQSTWVDYEHEEHLVNEQIEGTSQEIALSPDQPNIKRSSRAHMTQTWHNDYHISVNFVAKVIEAKVSPQFSFFMNTLSKISDPKHFMEASQHSNWLQAMNE